MVFSFQTEKTGNCNDQVNPVYLSIDLRETVAKPIFTLESRTDMYKVYYRSAELLANKFFEAEREGVSVDIQTLFKQFTLDTFGEIGFGTIT